MKKFALLITLLATGLAAYAGPVSKHGPLKVTGTQLTDQTGQPVVLRGVSFGWSNWWPQYYNPEAVHTLATDWQCSVLRAAMGVEPEGAYLSGPKPQTNLVTTVVEAAIKNDVYVIIDWHSHGIRTDEAVRFFQEMATRYGHYPNVIYEIFNEPVQTWKEVKDYSETVIRAIRAIDGDNLILVGNPHWDQDVHLVADDPLVGFDNIMYTLHFYAATHKEWLIERGNYALKKNIPLFVSECAGMEASGDGALDLESWGKWLHWMETNRISWVCWSISSKEETCSMMQPEAGPHGPWQDNDLKKWGIIARDVIRKMNRERER
ncbi:MAG: glycoside hydrolase family 5 protein [Dysgonamonadaceae bacterium]|nr:glycoside hydrolase family 5 protein [Dysgonamonadaceae bacterium]